jgi:hypothetical protein
VVNETFEHRLQRLGVGFETLSIINRKGSIAVRVCDYRTAYRVVDASQHFPGREYSFIRNPNTQSHCYSVNPEACRAVASLAARRLTADLLASPTSEKDKLDSVPW